uniref:Uncharacterized protein n=1 Tax=Arundo donax TaxID=35708 RepID=A0A0A9GLC8_ARUDO
MTATSPDTLPLRMYFPMAWPCSSRRGGDSEAVGGWGGPQSQHRGIPGIMGRGR